MSLKVEWVAYGRSAAEALHARVVAAKRDDPLRPVSIVVPTNYVGVSVRRLLASATLGPVSRAGAGLAGVTLLTVYRLAELLGAPRLSAAGRRPVSTPVIAAAVRHALRVAPGRFAPIADHPATEAALVRAHRELSSLSAKGLRHLEAQGERAADVVGLHRRVTQGLAASWYEETDLMAAATDVVCAGSPLVAGLGVVVVYLPQDLSRPAATLLRAVAERVPVEVLAGCTGVAAADTDVARSVTRLGADRAPPPRSPPVATEMMSVSDADEELRAAVRRIVAALRAGVPLERMALLYPTAQPYARLAHEHLTAAGLPYNGAAVRPLADRLLGRWLLDLLTLGDRGYRRQDVLDLLASAPTYVASGRRAPTARWERVSRTAGVVRGRGDWSDRLARFARQQRAEADRAEADEESPEWLADRLRREAGDAETLRGFVLELIGALEAGAGQRSWSGLVAWARGLAERYLGGEDVRAGWPEIERVAADKVDAALDRLAALDALDRLAALDAVDRLPGPDALDGLAALDAADADRPTPPAAAANSEVRPEVSPELLRRALESELDADLARVGRFGDGLLVGPLWTALGVDLDLVIVLGLAEGTLPSRVREDSLLPDVERASVAGELRLGADRLHVEHRHLLTALAASGAARVLSYPRGDLRRSVERSPSRWLLDTAGALQPELPAEQGRRLPGHAPWLTDRPSFAGSVATVGFPATRQEYALRALSDCLRAGGRVHEHPLARDDDALRLGLALLHARRSSAFTRFDGDLQALRELIPSPTRDGSVMSPTRLEAWARCPQHYLMEAVLGIQPVDNPEELLEISPLDVGTLVHGALEEWLCQALTGPVPDPRRPWPAEARAALARIAEQWCDRFEAQGLTGHPLLWGRDRARLLVDFDRFVEQDDARRAELGLRPVAVEVGFGLHAASPPVEVRLPDGRTGRFRGKIDRIDAADGGLLVVTDYKTGGYHDVDKLSANDPVLGGRKLQLPVYALAARAHLQDPTAPVRAEYWFVSTRRQFRRIGYLASEEVLDHFGQVLQTIVDGIEQGLFPARPPEPGWRPFVECPFCDPDGLGTADRWRAWERKRSDPRLAGYVRLVEPAAHDDEGHVEETRT